MIRFFLNSEWHEVVDIDPSSTILSYLRTNMMQMSVKEGCAAGDCGACTLMVAEPSENGLTFYTINSCIALLGHLHNRYLFTASSLGVPGLDTLHPVQQAMVDFHGAQCGFCTPGVVMSLAALYQQTLQVGQSLDSLTDDAIHHALSGNLCRCTGYTPIVRAAKALNDYPQIDLATSVMAPVQHWSPEPGEPLMTQADRTLYQPNSRSELNTLLAKAPGALLWAGGTDLGLELTQRFKAPDTIIQLERIPELQGICEQDDDIVIGAMTSYTSLESGLEHPFPSIARLVHRIASRQIRNLGTLGGNIANASPIGDLPPVFLSLSTTLLLDGVDGPRELPLQDFFINYKQTALRKGEYIAAVKVKKLAADERLFCWKISKRSDDDISALMMAIWLKTDGTTINEIRIACGGMAAIPKRALHTENALKHQPLTLDSARNAASAISKDFKPMSDVRASAEYRLQVAANLLQKLVIEYQASEKAEAVA